jgi:hypothetical protein
MRVRMLAGLAATVAVAGTAVAVQVAGMAAAHAAVTGVHQVTGPLSPIDSQPSKTVKATCPVGEQVIGGGGWVMTTVTADATKVTLTELQPVHPPSGADFYEVTGQEGTPNIATNWWVQSFAMCATPVPGLHIVSFTGPATASAAQAFCGSGEAALGGGGQINGAPNHVALSAEFPLFGNRWQASSLPAANFTGSWTVTAYAVCAPTPAGYQVVSANSSSGPTDPIKVALVNCPAGKHLLSPSAATKVEAPAGVALQVVFPSPSLDQVEAVAAATSPITIDWKPAVAVAVCAS